MKANEIFKNYLFVAPAVLIFSIFYIYPFYKVFTLALCQWDGIARFDFAKDFIGLRNFFELFQDKIWWSAMLQAGYITLIALTFQNALALMLALACDRDIKGGNIYRVIFYLPPVLSEIVVGLVWRWIYGMAMDTLEGSVLAEWLQQPCREPLQS